MEQQRFDVAVIGAGVIGACTARELARYDISVVVLEAGLDLACGATRANSGIVHAGYDPQPGTLKARYNVQGAALFGQWQRELGFAYYRNGALVVAFSSEERERLGELEQRARENGVKGVRIIGADELRELEPNVSPEAVAALEVPTSGICDPYGLTYGAAENAADNGVEFLFDHAVEDIQRVEGGYAVESGGKRIQVRAVVNAAGIHSDDVNNMVSGRKLRVQARKGEYLLYDNALAGVFGHTMFQVPGDKGKGVLVSPVVFGNPFIGPNAHDVEDKDDLSTTEDGMQEVLGQARRTWPQADTDKVIATYAGLRATDADRGGDFLVGEAPDAPGFFNAAFIDSPGLASAPAIAVDLAGMVARHLGARERADFDPQRTPPPLTAMMPPDAVADLVEQDPAYGREVCCCCHVTEGELVEALHRSLPVPSLDALKWRTGATMGPCHGGRCTAKIAKIMMRELGEDGTGLRKRLQGSEMMVAAGEDIVPVEELEAPEGMREVGAAEAGLAGTRPAGVYSAETAVGLAGVEGCLPGRTAVVWGTHELALEAALRLACAGVEIRAVVESGEEPAGPQELVERLVARGIEFRFGCKPVRVGGEGRMSAVVLAGDAGEKRLECDLLVVSPCLVPDGTLDATD